MRLHLSKLVLHLCATGSQEGVRCFYIAKIKSASSLVLSHQGLSYTFVYLFAVVAFTLFKNVIDNQLPKENSRSVANI